MFKTKQKISSVIVACLTMFVSVLLAVMMLVPANTQVTASAATTEIVFSLGANGTASHDDGSKTTTYSETVSGYTLSLTDGTNFYTGARDAKGNSCIKLGASSKTASFSFTVPDDVSSVIIAVSGYKAKTVTIKVNGTSQAITTTSDTGEYTDIKVDTTSTKDVSFETTSTGYRAMVNTITYVIESDEPTCEHANQTTTTTDATCTEAGSVVVICEDCGAQVSNTEIPATGHVNQTTTTTDATCTEAGSVVVTCEDCGAQVSNTEIPATGHDFAEPVYECNGDEHTATGTCNACGETTSETEDCTLEYAYSSNDNQTHNTTSTCSVCNKSVTVENEGCSFDEGVLNTETFIYTYTCEYCEYSYEEVATTYTVTYIVPERIEAVASEPVADGYTTTLPKAGTVEGYTFVGWVTEQTEKTENAPKYFAANTEYEVTEDTTLYALYSYAEGTGAFTLVKDATTLEAGKEIVIVASGSNYAIGTNQASNNRTAVAVTKSNDTVTWTTSVQIITLKAGLESGTWAFHVTGGTGTNAANGYLYATATGNHLRTQTSITNNSSWNITITDTGIATIKANVTSGQNWLRKNSSSALFACYSSGQNDVSIYMKDGATYYVTEFNTCAHENVDEVVEEATCTESGSRTVTCLDCESEIEAEILPALGHNFIDGICDNCGKADPASIIYDGYYYLSINNKYAGEQDGKYYKLFDFTPSETVDMDYVFYFVKNGETYDMYNVSNGLFASDLTIETQENYAVHISNSEGKILSFNTSYTTYNRLGFYATSNSYPCEITLIPVELSANIDEATITIGDDITLNYYVSMSTAFEGATMQFTVGDFAEAIEAEGVLVDSRYKFSLNLPPHYMTTNVKATLVFGALELDIIENYSIQTYADNQLNNLPSDALKQLLIDLLYYGAAAQNYKNYKTDNLATNILTDADKPNDAAPTTTDFTLVKNEEIDSYPAYFQGAGVYFDNVNKIFVKLSTTENVTLTINGAEVEITGTTIYTDGILATGFDTTYTFVLSCDGVVMQTLTYSVNAYAYAKKNDATMGELALALYRYGESAKAYKA